jgi:hypothetical protein
MVLFLEEFNYNTPTITNYMNNVLVYFRKETDIIVGTELTYEQLSSAWSYRSMDLFMISEMISMKYFNRTLSEKEKTFLVNICRLLEVTEDMKDYEKDFLQNDFNTYVMFGKIFKKDGKKKLEEELAQIRDRCFENAREFETKDDLFKMIEFYYKYVDNLPKQIN